MLVVICYGFIFFLLSYMKCPKCQNMDTKVIDSRVVEWWQAIRRRRECEFCGHRFTTFEKRGFTELLVIKKDGSKEMYDRQKLKKAILLAFAKRKFEWEEIDTMLNNLEMQWVADHNEIQSQQIWDDVLRVLKEVDPIAFVRFASVYRSFEDLDDFAQLLKKNK